MEIVAKHLEYGRLLKFTSNSLHQVALEVEAHYRQRS